MEGTINGFLQKGKLILSDKEENKTISELKISESRKNRGSLTLKAEIFDYS